MEHEPSPITSPIFKRRGSMSKLGSILKTKSEPKSSESWTPMKGLKALEIVLKELELELELEQECSSSEWPDIVGDPSTFTPPSLSLFHWRRSVSEIGKRKHETRKEEIKNPKTNNQALIEWMSLIWKEFKKLRTGRRQSQKRGKKRNPKTSDVHSGETNKFFGINQMIKFLLLFFDYDYPASVESF